MATDTHFEKLISEIRKLSDGDTPHRAAAAALMSIVESWSALRGDIDDGNLAPGVVPPQNLMFMYDRMIEILEHERAAAKDDVQKAFAN